MEPLQHIIDTYRHRKSRSYALIERMLRTYLRPYLWLLGLSVLANVVVAGTTAMITHLQCRLGRTSGTYCTRVRKRSPEHVA